VIVSDVDVEGGEKTREMIKKAGGETIFVKADVTKAGEVDAMIKEAVKTYGKLDCANNNAGYQESPTTTAECTEMEWDRTNNINLKGMWFCVKNEISEMLKHGSGAIVNTCSITGFVAFPGFPAYAASKHGVVGLTKIAALEYAKKGIRVNAVAPGPILTPMAMRGLGSDPKAVEQLSSLIPMGRMGRPEEVAEAIIWLCSDSSSFVTGHTMVVDGGFLTQ
jgi:NAD(P)-dependent dehydrogenase (short-subunit alcohol dehydrogenase family)